MILPAVLVTLFGSPAGAALPDGVVPYTEDGVPLFNLADATPEDVAQATAALAMPTRRWTDAVRVMLAATHWTPMATALYARTHPGLAWQVLRPDVRPLLGLIASLPEQQIEQILNQGPSVYVPWSEFGPDLTALVRSSDPSLVPTDSLRLRLDAMTWLNPWPTRILRDQLLDGDTLVDEGMFGIGSPQGNHTFGRTVGLWLNAGRLYATWSSVGAGVVALHHAPEVSGDIAHRKADQINVAAQYVAEWAGAALPADERIDVFLYADDTMPAYGLPAHVHYALPEHAQVHQEVQATRGHEVCHVVLQQLWGQAATDMVDEGVATYLNGDNSLTQLAQGRHLSDLQTLDAQFGYRSSDYLTAAFIVAFADAKLGPSGVRALWTADHPFVELSQQLGVTPDTAAGMVQSWISTITSAASQSGGRTAAEPTASGRPTRP